MQNRDDSLDDYNTALILCIPDVPDLGLDPRIDKSIAELERIRERLDSNHSNRWPAHVTVFYPFVKKTPAVLDETVTKLRQICSQIQPWTMTLRTFKDFEKRGTFVTWLDPEPANKVQNVYKKLAGLFGIDKDLSSPHMTVARNQKTKQTSTLQRNWTPMHFVPELVLVTRDHVNSPMKMYAKIAFAGQARVERPLSSDVLAVFQSFASTKIPYDINFDDQEKLWHHTFYNELRAAPEEHPVLLGGALDLPRASLEKITQMMFETFCVPAFALVPSHLLAMMATGHTTGLVVDMGWTFCTVVPVVNAKVEYEAALRLPVGGTEITEQLNKELTRCGYSFTTTAERTIVQDIKAKHCYVHNEGDEPKLATAYELPDGTLVNLSDDVMKSPAEALFSPSIIGEDTPGLAQLINASILKCDAAVQRDLFKHIFIVGGCSMLPGLVKRLQKEVEDVSLMAGSWLPVEVHAAPERQYMTWVGGSILSSLSLPKDFWMSKENYDEHGPAVIHQHMARFVAT